MAGIRPLFTGAQISNAIDAFIQEQDEKSLKRMQFLGEMFINSAKENGNYTDRTGNLRSSIGYIILLDGQVQDDRFTGTPIGVEEGNTFAESLAPEYPDGWVLIGVAGMKYAAYVEAKNYDVITGSVPDESIIRQLFSEIDI